MHEGYVSFLVAGVALLLMTIPAVYYFFQVNRLERQRVENAVSAQNYVKDSLTRAEIPSMLFTVWDGGYRLDWINEAFSKATGLTLEEAQAGMVWEIIHPDYRDNQRESAEAAGQRRSEFRDSYPLVNPHTGKTIGWAEGTGTLLPSPEKDCWAYISQIHLMDENRKPLQVSRSE